MEFVTYRHQLRYATGEETAEAMKGQRNAMLTSPDEQLTVSSLIVRKK
jgi:hypothetical protein